MLTMMGYEAIATTDKEYGYYPTYKDFLEQYFTKKLSFRVDGQLKQGQSIHDFTVRILDPDSYRTGKLFIGHGKKYSNFGKL